MIRCRRLFLLGLDKFGKGDWRSISRNFVISRTPTQVASHAQKYFIRLNFGEPLPPSAATNPSAAGQFGALVDVKPFAPPLGVAHAHPYGNVKLEPKGALVGGLGFDDSVLLRMQCAAGQL